MRIKILGIAVAALVLTASAYADAIFTEKSAVASPKANIKPNTQVTPLPVGAPLFGHVEGHATVEVEFTSTTNTLTSNGSFVTVPSTNMPIHDILLTPCFSDLHCNSFTSIGFTVPKPVITSMPNVSVVATLCTPDAAHICDSSDSFILVPVIFGTKEHDLTINATKGEVILSVLITSTGGFDQLKNLVVGAGPEAFVKLPDVPPPPSGPPTPETPVPEPSSILLLGSGVLGLAQVIGRKRL